MALNFTPAIRSYELETSQAFTGSTSDYDETQYALAGCVLKPFYFYKSDGTQKQYVKGQFCLLYVTPKPDDTGVYVNVDTWDIDTRAKDDGTLNKPGFRDLNTDAPYVTSLFSAGGDCGEDSVFYAGITPIAYKTPLVVFWIHTDSGSTPTVIALRNGIFSNAGAVDYGATETVISSASTLITSNGLVTHVTSAAQPKFPVAMICKGNTTSTNKHLICMEATIDEKATPSATADTWAVKWSKEYTTADWSAWTGRPDTLLDLHPILSGTFKNTYVALLGNWETPDVHKRVSDPRLALVTGPGHTLSLPKVTGVLPGAVVKSHADGATNKAHGITVDDEGYVYVVGTGDIVSNTTGYLICKYAPWDLSAVLVRVAHEANGLGDYYADPQDTHIMDPIWDGKYLMVFDHDGEKTRIFRYTKALVFVSVQTISETVTSYPRYRGGRLGHTNVARKF